MTEVVPFVLTFLVAMVQNSMTTFFIHRPDKFPVNQETGSLYGSYSEALYGLCTACIVLQFCNLINLTRSKNNDLYFKIQNGKEERTNCRQYMYQYLLIYSFLSLSLSVIMVYIYLDFSWADITVENNTVSGTMGYGLIVLNYSTCFVFLMMVMYYFCHKHVKE
jgi:low temperature requirement protein LtrA